MKELTDEELPLEPKKLTPYCAGYDTVFLSLNRYERKKNIELAIKAFHHFKTQQQLAKKKNSEKVLLVVAGGYDLRVEENVQYLEVRIIKTNNFHNFNNFKSFFICSFFFAGAEGCV